MTPRTRNSNSHAESKVYYSKKVPQQVHFPHRRKTIRRPSKVAKDDSDNRQIRFLPEKMRVKRVDTIGDSEQEDEEDMEDGGVAIEPEPEKQETANHSDSRGKKRQRVAEVEDSEEDDETVRYQHATKRRRRAVAELRRRSRHIKSDSDDERNSMSDQNDRKPERARTLRRQSTMTQLVEGRRPNPDTEEPSFEPVKRNPRVSWSGQGQKGKDMKQRTLTQMIPGMRPLEIMSDEDIEGGLSDVEAQERDSQAYGDALAARLAQDGLIQGQNDDTDNKDREEGIRDGLHLSASDWQDDHAIVLDIGSAPVEPVSVDNSETDEKSYQPTQYIEAPVTRTRRTPRRNGRQPGEDTSASKSAAKLNINTTRFGLLASPEKRRVREIASSQSPPESPLFTQVSPAKAHRSPLAERSSNSVQLAETPSKRKQVTFQELSKEPTPPPTLRKFRSVIQDSEDEEDSALIQNIDNATLGKAVGSETQAMLDQIDQACAHNQDAELGSQEPLMDSDETEHPRGLYEPLPELGEQIHQVQLTGDENIPNEQPSYHTAHGAIKQEPMHETPEPEDISNADHSSGEDVPSAQPSQTKLMDGTSQDVSRANDELPVAGTEVPSSPPVAQATVEDTCPSTLMVIVDSSDEEDMDEPKSQLTPPHQSSRRVPQPSAEAPQQSADLNDECVQVRHSPSVQHETQQSHSNKAEQQLQNEWFSYSQYVNDRPAQASSMHVGHDKFSYCATPMARRPTQPPQPSGYHMSQATTVDEVTPKKNRTQHTISANVTPHRIASSQPCFSPSKPPPLVIPSSFPSPAKSRFGDWSSPVLGRTQNTYGLATQLGSLEDFSIPPPPPAEDD
ncbi:hypothetical protein EK21DRAFT_75430 [Setomelanomma holmii]|uniref:Uncharacterized protein n=1 Tax=Setomelanomma holmii TaxID=210430 RepID=A0A9P4LHV4_9PLEO|nr:hypothetical protein EK21DRAFT_75430 [Setomelanomma holmii]